MTRPGYLHLAPDIAIYPNETKPWLPNPRDSAYLKLCDAHRMIGLPISTTQRRCRIDDATSLYEQATSRITRALDELWPIDIDGPAVRDLCCADAEPANTRELTAGRCTWRRLSIHSPYFSML